MRKLVVLTFVVVALAASGCGSKASDAEKADVAKVTTAISKMFTPGGAAISLAKLTGVQKQEIRFDELRIEDNALAFTSEMCSGFSSAYGAAAGGCTASCTAGQSVLGVNCTIPSTESTYVCGTATYKASGGTVGITMDFGSLTVGQTGYTGGFKLGVTFAANITGGNLSGGKLECTFGFNIDMATVATNFNPVMDCSNFSCKYDGKEIACEDLTAQNQTCKI